MSRQSRRIPVRAERPLRHKRAASFLARRCKELAFATLFGSIFLLSQSPLHALVIDDIRVLSKLGEPLQAQVRVISAAGERLTQSCFSAVSGAGDLPTVGNVRLTLTRQIDSQILRVTGKQPMREPMSEFVLQVKCAGSPTLLRSFLVMVDPPELVSDTQEPANEPQIATARTAASPRLLSRTGTRNTAIEPGSRYLVRNGDMLSTIASRVAGRPDWSVWPIAQQIYNANPGAFLMGDPNRIAEGSTIYVPRLDEVDFSVARETVSRAATSSPTTTTPSLAAETRTANAETVLPEPARIAQVQPVSARVAPRMQPGSVLGTPLSAMQLTVALGNESLMKLRLRRQNPPVADSGEVPAENAANTEPQPVPTTEPEVPDVAATPRVALPPDNAGLGWLGWLGLSAGLLLAFLLGAMVAAFALRRRPATVARSQTRSVARTHPAGAAAVATAPAVAEPPTAAEPFDDQITIDVREDPAPSQVGFEEPVHTVEVSTVPELDLELPFDEPAKVGAPQTLEMPEANESLDLELSPLDKTGRTGQHEVDFELLEKAYSEDYQSQFIDPRDDQPDQAPADNSDEEAQPTGETAHYYHLENRDPADETPLPIELGDDEMTGGADRDDDKIVNFPKSSSSG